MDRLSTHSSAKLICWCPEGVLTTQLIEEYYDAIAKVKWGNMADRYCDLSQLSGIDLTYPKMRHVAQVRKIKLNNARHLKLGIYAPSDLVYATARMYQSVMAGEDMEILISRDLKEVEEFLELDLKEFESEGEA